MDGIFSLPYSEYETILQVQKYFKKSGGLSVFIPVSRQQKGIDFVIVNTKNRKTLTVQVKGSRSYTKTEIPKRSKKELFKYNFWFNNFLHPMSKDRRMSIFSSVFTPSMMRQEG